MKKTTRRTRIIAVAILCLLALPSLAYAGSLSGRVTDDSGQGIASLTVKAKAPRSQGGQESVTTTGRDGSYELSNLRDARYLLTVSRGTELLYRKTVQVDGDTHKDIRLDRADS